MRRCRVSMTAGGAAKSMSATHSGRTSRPAYLLHLMESEWRRSMGWSKGLKSGSNFEVLIKNGRQVALAAGGNDDDDVLAGILRAFGDFYRGPAGGAGGNADE